MKITVTLSGRAVLRDHTNKGTTAKLNRGYKEGGAIKAVKPQKVLAVFPVEYLVIVLTMHNNATSYLVSRSGSRCTYHMQ